MKCAFCKKDFDIPYGMTVIQKDGTIKNFCASKCRKNSEMGRDNKKVKWVTKMSHNKEKAAEIKATNLARQELRSKEAAAASTERSVRKSAKVERAKIKEAKK